MGCYCGLWCSLLANSGVTFHGNAWDVTVDYGVLYWLIVVFKYDGYSS